MLHPIAQNLIPLANLDACFKKEVEKVTASKESSFCKPFVEDETVIGGPSFAIDEAENIINNPVNITLQDSMSHLTAETPLLIRKMHQKRCTQFFQNRRPTPLPKEGMPQPLLQPTPSPCEGNRTLCMAQLFSQHTAREKKKVSPLLSGLKDEKDEKSITKEKDHAKEKSIYNSGKPKAFSFGCLTPAIHGRSPVNCSPVLGFTFDSPLSPLPIRVEQRSTESDPTPPTAKRRIKKKFCSLSKRRGPLSPMNYDEEYRRSLKKRKLSPIGQIMLRKSPVNSPACSGLNSKSSLLSSGKKLFLHTPGKCSFSPKNMLNSPLELTRC